MPVEGNAQSIMKSYFTYGFCNYFDLFSTIHINTHDYKISLGLNVYKRQRSIPNGNIVKKIAVAVHVPQTTQNLVLDFTSAAVLLTDNRFVWWRSYWFP